MAARATVGSVANPSPANWAWTVLSNPLISPSSTPNGLQPIWTVTGAQLLAACIQTTATPTPTPKSIPLRIGA